MGESVLNMICGDCGSTDCHWASLNKGLYLCTECSFIHRSLGPQYSRIKPLAHSTWHPNLRKMVTVLSAGPANNVWEYALLNPSKSDLVVKKIVPGDPLETVKKRFITLKHGQFQFVLRQKADTFDERNEELHSTVRTADLGTALRLIASGADPNFFHPERGTRPLHVACKSGQALQVELLFVHGAQIDAPDYLGQTPAEHAMAAGFKDLANRIDELRYHLTDQLSFYACGEFPDHATPKHILIPLQNININTALQEESIKALPSYMLEQLASDLYDEVDRRQTEKVLLSTSTDHARFSIAFLPVNPNFLSVRNQTRQKFARLTDSELSSLIIVALREAKRRHWSGSNSIETEKDIFSDNNLSASMDAQNISQHQQLRSAISAVKEDDEFPLYDSVASDDDVVMSEVHTVETHNKTPPIELGVRNSNINSVPSCAISNTAEKCNSILTKLAEERIAEMESNNLSLKYELQVVKKMLSYYIQDNLSSRTRRISLQLTELDHLNSNHSLDSSSSSDVKHSSGSPTRGVVLRQHSPTSVSSNLKKLRSVSMYAEKVDHSTDAERNLALGSSFPGAGSSGSARENVKKQMSDLVQVTTRNIVELIKILIEYARTNDYQGVQLTANKIYGAAQDMISVLLQKDSQEKVSDSAMKSSLQNVLVQVLRMKTEVPLLSNSTLLAAAMNDTSKNLNDNPAELYVQKIKQICFDVGAAMKLLVSTVVTAPSS